MKTVKYSTIDIELDDKTYRKLIRLGMKWTKDDPQALISYAANRVLGEYIKNHRK